MAIDAEAISFAYPDGFQALKNVRFQARRGEFVAMLASNGSGKTTLMKVLLGLLHAQKGTVRINGRLLKEYSQKELYQTVSMVFQNPNDQLFAATVAEDVAFGPRNLGLDKDEVQRRVTQALAAVGASELAQRAVHHLSFGQQKRASIAGVLAMRPSIMILDEPTAGLDPAGEHEMLELLGELNRRQGITIVMATHQVDMLPLFADRIYLLNRGEVLSHGSPAEIFGDEEMIRRAALRLPYISQLLDDLKRLDGVPLGALPLTLNEARRQLVNLIPKEFIFPVTHE